MKKLLLIIGLTLLLSSMTFAAGLTQYDLAELLVNKAVAEKLIENKDYSKEEVIALVEESKLYEITNADSEVPVETVREVLADYETKKHTLKLNRTDNKEPVTAEVFDREAEMKRLEGLDRKLSHEFMVEIDEKDLDDNLYENNLDGFGTAYSQKFHYHDAEGGGYDVYPLIDKYRYELYRILGWYAIEYDLYVEQSNASVALYSSKLDYMDQTDPLIIVGFSQKPTDDNDDGVAYTVRMKVSMLYDVIYKKGESRENYGKRIAATGLAEPRFVMALRDVSSVFIKDEEELNAFVDSYVADVVENQNKEYSYEKLRHEYFGENRYFIDKVQGAVFYFIDYDLSKWEE